jgi:hypothetical protein
MIVAIWFCEQWLYAAGPALCPSGTIIRKFCLILIVLFAVRLNRSLLHLLLLLLSVRFFRTETAFKLS